MKMLTGKDSVPACSLGRAGHCRKSGGSGPWSALSGLTHQLNIQTTKYNSSNRDQRVESCSQHRKKERILGPALLGSRYNEP